MFQSKTILESLQLVCVAPGSKNPMEDSLHPPTTQRNTQQTGNVSTSLKVPTVHLYLGCLDSELEGGLTSVKLVNVGSMS